MDPQTFGKIGAIKGVINEHLDIISKLIDVPSYAFDVMDRDGDIYLIHHKSEYPDYSRIRGTIINVKEKKIICDGSELPKQVMVDKIFVSELGVELIDSNNILNTFVDPIFERGYEGASVRIFKIQNKVYYATHKTLFFQDKKWGMNKSFGEMWEEIISQGKGPILENEVNILSEKDLFGNQENGTYCYHFLMVHKNLQVGSRFLQMEPGFIIFVDKNKIYQNGEEIEFSVEKVDISRDITKSFITTVDKISLEEANNYLKYGLYSEIEQPDDVRLRTGEFIIVRCNESGKTAIVKSSGYEWRVQLRNSKGYIPDRFYELFNDFVKDKEMLNESKFLEHFIPFQNFETPNIVPKLFVGTKWPISIDMGLRFIFRCFLSSLPPHLQPEYKDFLSEYFSIRKSVTNWITDICLARTPNNECGFYHKRIQTIITQARKFAKNGGHYGKDLVPALKTNIKYLVNKEYPFSVRTLYDVLYPYFEENKPSQNVITFVYPEPAKK